MSTAKRALRACGIAVLLAFATAAAAEIALQIGARLVRDRSDAGASDGRTRIVGVGDSHMFGAMVEEDESFPAQLGIALEEREPGGYSVVNLGVPGMNTTQVRNRFLENLEIYRPDVMLVWCGINNKWNRSEIGEHASVLQTLEAYAQRSRLYRMYRVWRHNQEIDRGVRLPPVENRGEAAQHEGEGTWTIRHGGRDEVLAPRRFREKPEKSAVRERAYEDYKMMVRWAEAAGVQVVFVGYPIHWGYFASASNAMMDVAAESSAVFVSTKDTFDMLPESERKLLPGAHPDAAAYRAIARLVAPTIIELTR